MPHQLSETAHTAEPGWQPLAVTRQTTGHSMHYRANTVWRFSEVERYGSAKKKRNFLIQSQVEQIMIQQAWRLTAKSSSCVFSSLVFTWAGTTRERTRSKEHTRLLSKHVTPELSPACHTCVTFTEAVTVTNQTQERLLKIPACRCGAAQSKQTLQLELIEGTMEDLWNVLPQQKPLRKTIEVVFAFLCRVTRLSWACACSAPCSIQRELSV